MKLKILIILFLLGTGLNITLAQMDIGQPDPRIQLYRNDPYGNFSY